MVTKAIFFFSDFHCYAYIDDAFRMIQLWLPFMVNHMWAGVRFKNLGETHCERCFLIAVNEAVVFSSNAVYRVECVTNKQRFFLRAVTGFYHRISSPMVLIRKMG